MHQLDLLNLGERWRRRQKPPKLEVTRTAISDPEGMMNAEILELQASLRAFAEEREWDQFHSPKNLATALSVEVAELLEHFQWLTEDQSRSVPDDKREVIAEEVADVFLYLLQLADKLGIDPVQAAQKKMQTNAIKYPVERAKGSSKKYSEL